MPADYENLYIFPQNPEHLAVWEEKLSAIKIYELVTDTTVVPGNYGHNGRVS